MRLLSFSRLQFLVLIASALVRFAAAASRSNSNSGQPVVIGDAADCDCFLANGSQPGYYAHHMFFDFRSLTQDAGVPAIVANQALAGISGPASAYFSGDEWASVWQLQGWNNSVGGAEGERRGLSGEATVLMVNSPANVYIQKNDDGAGAASETYLTMRTQRLPGFQSAAAFQTRSAGYQFLSLRMLARTTGSPGAVTAMFTYRGGPSSSVQEADAEFLTRGPRENAQYTNQPSYNQDGSVDDRATRNATLPNGLMWSDWVVHRLDWTPQASVWYVDGAEAASISFQAPREPSSVNFNAWSDGGSWSGNMSLYDEASLQIQWIEMVYNTTGEGNETAAAAAAAAAKRGVNMLWGRDVGPRGDLVRRKGRNSGRNDGNNNGCRVVCSIDDAPEAGNVTMLWNSTATRMAGADMGGHMAYVWTLMIGGLVWFWLI